MSALRLVLKIRFFIGMENEIGEQIRILSLGMATSLREIKFWI